TVWSVSLNPEKYNTSAADLQGVRVTLTDHTLGEVSEFFEGCGKHFYINHGNYGVNNAIIFRPDYAIYPADGHYTVVITGLRPKGDNPATIQYSVRFFSLP
ncbi:MAG: hypothetical protein LBC72_01130, partial [Spirochaetaceae bacterium]|nr:hypothetical protein [Spirochaetaceae bacterium]